MKKIFLSVVLTFIVLFAALLVYIYSGWYDVSAMNEESGISKWVLETTMDNSVESRSRDITIPYLNDTLMIKEGFEHYNEMCVDCHGAPGKEESELSKGLNPPAPYLVEEAKDMDPREIFWITKYGIKMTGMPAWGKTHSDDKIWAMVTFIKKLPNMSAEEYEKMENTYATMEMDEDHHNEEHHH